MTKKNKGRALDKDAIPKTTDSLNHTRTELMMGWFKIAKPSRNRQQKRGWKRNQRGQIDYSLSGQLALLLVILTLVLSGGTA